MWLSVVWNRDVCGRSKAHQSKFHLFNFVSGGSNYIYFIIFHFIFMFALYALWNSYQNRIWKLYFVRFHSQSEDIFSLVLVRFKVRDNLNIFHFLFQFGPSRECQLSSGMLWTELDWKAEWKETKMMSFHVIRIRGECLQGKISKSLLSGGNLRLLTLSALFSSLPAERMILERCINKGNNRLACGCWAGTPTYPISPPWGNIMKHELNFWWKYILYIKMILI